MTNFGIIKAEKVGKKDHMKSATMDEDDYIEEEFEEVIDSDNESSDSSPESDTSEKQRRFEAMRKGQQA